MESVDAKKAFNLLPRENIPTPLPNCEAKCFSIRDAKRAVTPLLLHTELAEEDEEEFNKAAEQENST
jgi:hypothetical protein